MPGGVGGGAADGPAASWRGTDLDAGDARFVRLLELVGVGIVPDGVADDGVAGNRRPHVGEVGVLVDLARGQDDRPIGIRLALVGHDVGQAGEHAVQVGDVHSVAARLQAREEVAAIGIGDRAGHFSAAAVEVEGDVGDTGLADVLDAVGVAVVPHEVADSAQAHEARIPVKVRRGCRREDDCSSRGGVGITVLGRIAALARRGESIAGWQDELHLVAAGWPVGEQVGADGVGGCGRQQGARPVQKPDRHAGHAGLAGVLDAVAVQVLPHEVTDGRAQPVAEVRAQVALPLVEGDDRCGVVVRGGLVAGRHRGIHHVHEVVVGRQVLEQVQAGGVGGTRADQDVRGRVHVAVTVVLVQPQLDVGDAGLARILDCVAVLVVPDAVADLARADAGLGVDRVRAGLAGGGMDIRHLQRAETGSAESRLVDLDLVDDVVDPVRVGGVRCVEGVGGGRVDLQIRAEQVAVATRTVAGGVQAVRQRGAPGLDGGGAAYIYLAVSAAHAQGGIAGGRAGGGGQVVDLEVKHQVIIAVVAVELGMIRAGEVAERVAAWPANGVGAVGVVHEILVYGQYHVNRIGRGLVVRRQLAKQYPIGIGVANLFRVRRVAVDAVVLAVNHGRAVHEDRRGVRGRVKAARTITGNDAQHRLVNHARPGPGRHADLGHQVDDLARVQAHGIAQGRLVGIVRLVDAVVVQVLPQEHGPPLARSYRDRRAVLAVAVVGQAVPVEEHRARRGLHGLVRLQVQHPADAGAVGGRVAGPPGLGRGLHCGHVNDPRRGADGHVHLHQDGVFGVRADGRGHGDDRILGILQAVAIDIPVDAGGPALVGAGAQVDRRGQVADAHHVGVGARHAGHAVPAVVRLNGQRRSIAYLQLRALAGRAVVAALELLLGLGVGDW